MHANTKGLAAPRVALKPKGSDFDPVTIEAGRCASTGLYFTFHIEYAMPFQPADVTADFEARDLSALAHKAGNWIQNKDIKLCAMSLERDCERQLWVLYCLKKPVHYAGNEVLAAAEDKRCAAALLRFFKAVVETERED